MEEATCQYIGSDFFIEFVLCLIYKIFNEFYNITNACMHARVYIKGGNVYLHSFSLCKIFDIQFIFRNNINNT